MKAMLCATASAVAMLAATGHAAEAPAAPPAGTSTGIEDIIVRAQRVEQSLQKVPVAVTPVSGKELETKRLHDLPQLTLAVPSLQVTTDNAFTLRGIGSQIFSANVDSSVGVMADNVSLGVPIFMSNAAFVDIDQVEVLTGPQGLLFGRNASAGLMNIITKRPEIGHTTGEVSAEYDDRDTAPGGHFGIVLTGIANVPTSANSALRINLLESVQDPIAKTLSDAAGGLQDKQVRTMGKLKWLYEPNAGFSAYVVGDYSRERGVGGIWDDSWRVTGAGGGDLKNATADGITASPTNLYKRLNGANFRSVDTGGLSLTLTDKLSDALTLSNILAWRAYTLDYNLESGMSGQSNLPVNGGHQTYNQISDELRLAYKEGRIDGQFGLYGFISTNDASALFDGTAGTGIPHFIHGTNSYHLYGRSLAAYDQTNFHLTDQITLLAGARVTNDHVSTEALADNYTQTLVIQPFGPFGPPALPIPLVNVFGPLNQSYAAAYDHTNFSYKLGAQYNINADTMLYVTWATGYKGPAMQTNLSYTGQSPVILPETVKDLEAGIKAVLFDRKLRFNVAGFVEKFSNFQAQSFANISGSQISVIGNAEGVKATGVEINTTFKPVHGLTFNYNATLEDSHFTLYSHDPCYFGQTSNGCSTNPFYTDTGTATSTSAHYSGTLEAAYEIPVGVGAITLESNWYHRSAINFTTSAAPYAELGAIDVFGASVTWRNGHGLTLAVFCKNCGNELYPNYIGSDPGDAANGVLSTINRWGYNSLRTIGASANFKF